MKKKGIVIVISGVFLLVLILRYYRNIYEIEDRTNKIESFVSVDDYKAMSWIRVQGTNIDMPVMFYDNVSDVSNPTYDIAWSYTEDNKLPDKTTIFSHNVLNVSSNPLIGNKEHKRFEQLMAYIYIDFVKENKYIQYTINNKNYLFKIYSVSFQNANDLEYEKSSFSSKELRKYIQREIEKSYFKFDIDVDENDDLLTLVTCTRFFGANKNYSFVVDARKVRTNEKNLNYRVTEKSNYKKIKKIMEGETKDV